MPDHPITGASRAAFEITLWPAPARAFAASVWFGAAFLGPPALAWAVLAFDPPAGPILPVLAFAGAVGALHGARWLVARAGAGEAVITADRLEVRAWDRSFALPLQAVAAVRPWRFAVPMPGLRIDARDGASLRLGLERPAELLHALAAAGPPTLRAQGAQALAHPAVADAQAAASRKASRHIRSRTARTALRVGVWSLVPACAFFYTHQSIAFGGLWGEWWMIGPVAWVRTFARFWITCAVLAFVLSSLCRGVAGLARWSATRVAPSHAARARRVTGAVDAAAYFVGVPVLTALRYLP